MRARYVWDYDVSEEQFDALLAGQAVVGRLDRTWAAARLIDSPPYDEIVRRIGFGALVRHWPEWRPRVRSSSARRGLDFLVEWLPRHHPELLAQRQGPREDTPMSDKPINRRDALKLGGAAAASVLLVPATRASAAAWKPIPIGTQLWCVRKQLASEIPGTLKALGAMGYQGVELENAFGKSGAEWRSHLDAAGLKACGFHHTLAELQGDKLAASVEFNKAIGNRNLIIRWMPEEYYRTVDDVKRAADQVNEAAAKAKPHGMRVGYHNHTMDFKRIDGEYWWNRFADLTAKDVILQFDTGNASEMEGVTPQSFITRNAGRTVSMHVKPFSKKDPTAYLGKDELDWPAIMKAAETVGGTEWYIIEYEREGVPPLESLKANLELFKKLRA